MADDTNPKDLIERIGRAFEEFKATHAQQLAEVKKGVADAVTETKLKAVNDELDKLIEAKEKAEKASVERMDDLEARLNRARIGSKSGDDGDAELKRFNGERKSVAQARGREVEVDIDEKAYADYKPAFVSFLRKGEKHAAFEAKAMSVGSDVDGGYLVPSDVSGRIVTRLFDTSPMRQISGQQTIGTNELEGLRDIDEAAAGWVSEVGARTATTSPVLGKWSIVVHEAYANPEATQKLLDDANINLANWLADKVAEKLSRLENTAFVSGDGVGKPRGFTTYTTAATLDATRTWGELEHVVTGANGAFAGTSPADVLFDLIGRFKQGYLDNARWVTNRAVIALVRKFKEATTLAYMWQPGLQQGAPQTLLGYPITYAEDMPLIATGSLSMALGNFSLGYTVVDRAGITMLRDPYSNKPFVQFYTTKRVGGGVVQFEAIKFLKFST